VYRQDMSCIALMKGVLFPVHKAVYSFVWNPDTDERVHDILKGRVSNGLVVVGAHSEEDAWELLKKEDVVLWWHLNGEPITPLGGRYIPYGDKLAEWLNRSVAEYVYGYNSKSIRPVVLVNPTVVIRHPVY